VVAPWVLVLGALGGAAALVTRLIRRRLASRGAAAAG
jgi:hypothetical protein